MRDRYLLIGETTLLVRCAEVLLRRGQQVVRIVSDDAIVADWASVNGVECIPFHDDWNMVAPADRPDYLLSIVNAHVLSPVALATPRKLAINYHDGPLPRYAGMHATSWAIINGEREHGITWHEMASTVDAGRILRQARVPIEPDDTSLTLNAKCYEAAARAFTELVDDLERGTLRPRPQDATQRTYFGRYRRPAAAGVLSWERPATELAALVRGLDFGPYANPLGTAKFALGGEMLSCSAVEIDDTYPTEPPGTVLEIADETIVVATADSALVIGELTAATGEPRHVSLLQQQGRIRVGQRLDRFDDPARARLTELAVRTARTEAFWVDRLQSVTPPPLHVLRMGPNAARRRAGRDAAPQWRQVDIVMPADFLGAPGIRAASTHRTDGIIAAFVAVLARVSGTHEFDLAVSTPSLAAELAGVESLASTHLPCRFRFDASETIAMSTAHVATALRSTRGHGPFLRDISLRYPELRAIRARLSHAPGALPIAAAMATDVTRYVADPGTALALVLARDGSRAVLAFDDRLLDAADVHEVARWFTTFMQQVAKAPGVPLGKVPMVDELERRRLLEEWNDTAAPFPDNATVPALIRQRASATPAAVAVEAAGRALSYAEVLGGADRLAERLRARGVGRDVVVAVWADRTPEMVVALLGVLCAGGAYLPIDPFYPLDRVHFMLRDAAVPVLITHRELAERFAQSIEAGATDGASRHQPTIMLLDALLDDVVGDADRADDVHDVDDVDDVHAGHASAPAPTQPHEPATPDSLAYVIYTSGSTGTPKGVMVEHRGVVNYLTWCIAAYGLEAGRGAPVHSSIAFDLTVTSLLAPLAAGRSVVLAPDAADVEALSTLMRNHEDFTLVKLTPSHLDLLRQQLPPDAVAGRTRCFVVGGEALHGASVQFWREHAPATRIVNEYGPTETVVGCCVHEVTDADAEAPDVPIGRPIANTRLYVLDTQMQLLPTGVPGELYIGGVGVARGYLDRPALTAERFVRDPFTADARSRLYRTGDLVRWRGDGCLEFLGRLDNQVKLRGHRIELGEVEAVLTLHPDVEEAAVVVHMAAPGDARLVAYPVQRAGSAATASQLRDFLAARLPSHMLPSAFVAMDALPLTSNGKVDRSRLPMPVWHAEASSAAPRHALEHALAGIWSDVLGVPVDAIGIDDNFFDMGGHSLLAVRMMHRVEELLLRRPPLATLLVHPTIRTLAVAMESSEVIDDEMIVHARAGRRGVPPLFYFHGSFNSGGYYCHRLIRELDDDQPVYVVHTYQPGGPETIEAMAEAILPEIREREPSGPYHFGGLCNGGTLAFEVARRLRESGEHVGALMLVNTTDRNSGLRWMRRAVATGARWLSVGARREADAYRVVREFAAATRRTWARAREGGTLRAAWTLASRGLRKLMRAPSDVRELHGDFDAGDPTTAFVSRATESFAPAPYDGPITVVFWEDSDALRDSEGLHGDDLTRGWGKVSRDVRVVTVPGHQRTEHLRDAAALGREVAAVLHEANARLEHDS